MAHYQRGGYPQQIPRYGQLPVPGAMRMYHDNRQMALMAHGTGPRSRPFDIRTLPVEILAAIMTMCRVEEVVKLEQMCKLFNTVSRETRSIWLICLQTLDYDHAPDLPPHIVANIHNIPTEEIRRLTVRAVRGFYNWTCPRFMDGRLCPVPSREHHIHLIPSWSKGRPSLESLAGFRAQLVTGGEYLVVNNHGTLEIVKLPSNEYMDAKLKSPEPRSGSGSSSLEEPLRIWRDQGHVAGDDILGFGNDIVDEGKTLITAAVTLRYVYPQPRSPRRLWLRVIRFDIYENRSSVLSEVLLPDHPNLPNLNMFSTFEVTVHDKFIAVCALPGPITNVYLQNWRTRQSVILSIPTTQGPHFVYYAHTVRIASDHLFIGLQTPARSAAIAALPFHLFSAHWRPNTERQNWLSYPFVSNEAHIAPLHREGEISSVISLRAYRSTWADVVTNGKGKGKGPINTRDGPVIVTALISKSSCAHELQDVWTFRYVFRADAFGIGGTTSTASGVGRIHVGPFELLSEKLSVKARTPSPPPSASSISSPASTTNSSLSGWNRFHPQPIAGPSNQGRFAIAREPIELCHALNQFGRQYVVPTEENVPGMRGSRNVSIEPWSGAVVFWEPGFVVVRYYE